jgi:3-hydroxyisobutyrate dehydrogenase
VRTLRVGFIGLGIMGTPMAGHLLAAGFPLTVFNRTPGKTAPLAARGAVVAPSPAALATRSDVIITMVSDSPDVEAVVTGPGGVLEGIRPGTLVIDMSTVAPEVERRLDTRLRERGCALVDAPVSGGDVGARNATLAIMAGGDAAAIDRARPVLSVLGKTITHCGPVGSGQVAKLCNQILVAVTLLGVSEAIAFARRNGLDPAVMIRAVEGGAAQSWQLQNLGPKILGGDFAPGFMIDLIQKDLRLVQEAAATTGAALPATGLARRLFAAAQERGEGREGTQALAKAVDRLSGPGAGGVRDGGR